MGLLALVAAAGKRGVSRERVVGILWGEAGEEQARHTLSQNLYTLRRETGRDWIVATPELRLHPAVGSDVDEFQEALAADDLPRAAALYSGEFLEGFYLAGVPEFERWVEEERARLEAAALRALEVLAARADEAGRHHEAIGWWRRLAALDPLGARNAAGLMRALAAAGDQASALAHLKSHRELVKRELDADPDPAILSLAASFRHTAVAAAPDSRLAAAAPAPPVPDTSPTHIAGPGPAPSQRIRALVTAVVAVAALTALAAAAWRLVGPDAVPPRPFLAVGVIRTADSAALGGVLRDMLATNLGSIRDLQVVANSRLLELTPRGADTLPGATADAARRAGATDIIEGELISVAGDLRLTLRRVALASGLVRQGYTVHAPDATRLMDSATAAIARDLRAGPPSGEMATIRTSSPAAYALYEEGLRALYGGEPEDAYHLMRAALDRDSSFAMAAYYGWVASRGIVPGLEGDRDLRRLAKLLAPRTIERERLLIDGFVAGQTAAVATAIAIAETLSIRYPADPDGQNLLGFTYASGGNWSGAIAAFERAIAIDSVAGATSGSFCRVCLALSGMTNVFVGWDSLGAAERTARRLLALRPEERAGWSSLAEPLLRQGKRGEALAALRRHDALGRPGDWSRGVIQRDMIRQGQFEELEPQLLADLAHPEMQGGARWLMLISLRNQGRYREAMALARDGVVAGSPARRAGAIPERLHQAILLMETGRPGEAAVRFREMAAASQADSAVSGLGARHTAWRLTLAGTALAAAGDTASVRRIADSVERIGRESNFGRDPRLHHFLRGLILQRGGRHAEAVEAFQRATHTLSDGYTRINRELARSLMALGRPDEAISVLRPALRGGVDGSNTYLTHTELHEALAQAFELAGRFDSAAVHYRAVERGWRRADPQFSARYAKARMGARMPY